MSFLGILRKKLRRIEEISGKIHLAEIVQDETEGVFLVFGQFFDVLCQVLVSLCDFVQSDNDDRLSFLSQFHILVDLQVVIGVGDLRGSEFDGNFLKFLGNVTSMRSL